MICQSVIWKNIHGDVDMNKGKPPATPATRALKAAGIEYSGHLYRYEDHGGTAVCARELGIDERAVIKTLVMEDEEGSPLVVLMHGDLSVSTKALARTIGVKAVSPCDQRTAKRHTGYQVGGTSPFGSRKLLPVYMEKTILELPLIYINGGRRGFLVSISPAEVVRLLNPTLVSVGMK